MKISEVSNVPTKDLCDFLITHLTSLGFSDVSADERWEGDGVFIVGPPPIDPDVHWYLSCIGTGDADFSHGVDIIFILPDGSEQDLNIQLEDLSQIEQLLREHKYIP